MEADRGGHVQEKVCLNFQYHMCVCFLHYVKGERGGQEEAPGDFDFLVVKCGGGANGAFKKKKKTGRYYNVYYITLHM